MKTAMRLAFEECKLPKNPTKDQLDLARRLINRMDRQDANAAQRKRVRKTPAVPEVREQ
jgi:hypothetical protein